MYSGFTMDLPIENGGSFHRFFGYVYQVGSPNRMMISLIPLSGEAQSKILPPSVMSLRHPRHHVAIIYRIAGWVATLKNDKNWGFFL